MERSSGLKECPRCGLRNRQGAYQCDFCGWDFRAASDDWMGQVNDLERIGREAEVFDMDTAVKSRIELTMKNPADIPIVEKKAEADLEMPPHLSLDDNGDVISHPVEEIVKEEEPQPEPQPEAQVVEEIVTVEEPEPVTEQAIPEVPVQPEVVEEPVVAVSSMPRPKVTSMPQFVPGGLLAMGLGVYALDIYVVSAGILTGGTAWAISILASLLMVYAVIRYLPMITRGKKEEAVLCPVCHEMVSEKDSRCPSCGVRFREAPSRE